MDKDIKELAEKINNSTKLIDYTLSLHIAETLIKAGYILPSPSPMKLIKKEQMKLYCDEHKHAQCPEYGDCCECGAEAQLLADQKAHAGMTKELVDAYEAMLDGMGLGQDNFKASDWQNVQDLKARYGG